MYLLLLLLLVKMLVGEENYIVMQIKLDLTDFYYKIKYKHHSVKAAQCFTT